MAAEMYEVIVREESDILDILGWLKDGKGVSVFIDEKTNDLMFVAGDYAMSAPHPNASLVETVFTADRLKFYIETISLNRPLLPEGWVYDRQKQLWYRLDPYDVRRK